jgi:cellulose synthase/poly-beta-1,6-N-acetylglucosamine synthase-like glycosyltransferase
MGNPDKRLQVFVKEEMTARYFISVIVPVYNGEKDIGNCMESVISQDYPTDKYEVIVVDNGSKDRTADILKKYPVKYVLENKVRSSYAARNAGIVNAKGDILAFTDADCVAGKNWLKEGGQAFAGEDIGCVAGAIKGCGPANFVEEYLNSRGMISQEEKTEKMPFPYAKTANAFYRKEVFDRTGRFEERWVSGGDADLCWRMQINTGYKIRFASGAAVCHRQRSSVGAMFKQCVTWGKGYTLLYKKYRDKMPKRTLKQVIWIICRLFSIPVRLLPFYFSDKEKMNKEKREKYLDLITFMGWDLGRIIGSIRNGVFYI